MQTEQQQSYFEFMREEIRGYVKLMDDFRKEYKEDLKEIKSEFKDVKSELKDLRDRFGYMENNINFIKSIFSNYKVWITFFIFIIVLVGMLEPHSIFKGLKSIKDIF